MVLLQGVNLGLSFLLELCALAALGYWGYRAGSGAAAKVSLAVGIPLATATLWGIFVAPRAAVPVPGALNLAIKALVFGLAAAGLATTGHRALAGVFAATVIVNAILARAWGQ